MRINAIESRTVSDTLIQSPVRLPCTMTTETPQTTKKTILGGIQIDTKYYRYGIYTYNLQHSTHGLNLTLTFQGDLRSNVKVPLDFSYTVSY